MTYIERIQVSMLAPTMYPVTSKLIRMNFPCRCRDMTEESGTRCKGEISENESTTGYISHGLTERPANKGCYPIDIRGLSSGQQEPAARQVWFYSIHMEERETGISYTH